MRASDRREGFDEASFAEVYGLCLRAALKARRLGDLEDIHEVASRLAEHARLKENAEAEQKSQKIRAWAEYRNAAMLAQAREGGRARAAKLSPERRRQIAKAAAAARWSPAV
jgi:hypothetical protein